MASNTFLLVVTVGSLFATGHASNCNQDILQNIHTFWKKNLGFPTDIVATSNANSPQFVRFVSTDKRIEEDFICQRIDWKGNVSTATLTYKHGTKPAPVSMTNQEKDGVLYGNKVQAYYLAQTDKIVAAILCEDSGTGRPSSVIAVSKGYDKTLIKYVKEAIEYVLGKVDFREYSENCISS